MKPTSIISFMATGLTILVSLGAAPGYGAETASQVSAVDVAKAFQRGREYLVGLANPDGSFGGSGGSESGIGGISAFIFMTLACLDEDPATPHMSKGLDYLLQVDADQGFGSRQGYCVPIRIIGLSHMYSKLQGEKKDAVRRKIAEDVTRLVKGQATNGGWRYMLKGGSDHDFSVAQWPLLAFHEANLAGIEFPLDSLRKARDLYYKCQNPDGGWHYNVKGPSYGSMSAAGAASLFILNDVLDPSAGCPCTSGYSRPPDKENKRRMDLALGWLDKNFSSSENPHSKDQPGAGRTLYWLYIAERVGLASGYKYFGDHDWYKEGAARIVASQMNGRWGDTVNTCFALLFLFKGRAPLLFNKVQFDGDWNSHPRDIAFLTRYIERLQEQPLRWQVVDLKAPMEELREAPILYISANSPPTWDQAPEALKKLREFTDTGGTILFEASCGNPKVRKWFMDFAKKVWPEWSLQTLAPEHDVFNQPMPLKARPALQGIDDSRRTIVFYSPDDVSCAWQAKGMASKDYLLKWGINLYTYATKHSPLRPRLAAAPDKAAP
jgi:hypothetical protein